MAGTNNQKFFAECMEQSEVKASIVEKYFYTWAKIIDSTQQKHAKGDNRIAYIDLFAGPGRYEDGTISTPIRVLQKIIQDPSLVGKTVTLFNDRDQGNASNLQSCIDKLEGKEKLKYSPIVQNMEVGDEIAKIFESRKNVPILAFIDPWGYKGLSLRLVDSFLKDWGCDCIFFFNYSRINAGLSNPVVKEHMEALFGKERAEQLATTLEGQSPADRESTIVEALAQALRQFGHRYVLPFCFKNASGRRTSHHLILVTKHFKGYEVMKEIMAKASSSEEQGVASFTYNPADKNAHPLLFELNRPLDDLRDLLLADFQGKEIVMDELYKTHSVDRPFIRANYKTVLAAMEADGAISVANRKSKRGFADDLRVQFPARGV